MNAFHHSHTVLYENDQKFLVCVYIYRERIKEADIYNRTKLFFRVTLCFLAPKHPMLFPFSDIVVGGPQPLLFGRGELCSLAEKQTIFFDELHAFAAGKKWLSARCSSVVGK